MTPNHNPDHNIDRVLHALREARPPAGMERRILNILEAESDRRTLPTRTRLHAAWATAAACCATLTIAAIIATFTMRHHDAPTASTTPTTTAQPRAVQSPIAATPTTFSKPTHHALAPAHPSQPHRVETNNPEEDAQISHPAPPIPLTDQERILLRYARRGRTEDLAQISTERKAAKEEQEAAEFQAFFKPIVIGESE